MITSTMILIAIVIGSFFYFFGENKNIKKKIKQLMSQIDLLENRVEKVEDQDSVSIQTEVIFKKTISSEPYNREGFEIRYALKIKGTNGLILMKIGSYQPLPVGDPRLDDGYLGTLTFNPGNPGTPDGYTTSFIPLIREQGDLPAPNAFYKFEVVDLTSDPERPANGQDTRQP